MSFFDVLMRYREPSESISQLAKRLGRSRTTLRQWQICEPLAWMVVSVAENLGVDSTELFREYAEDYRRSHPEDNETEIASCSNAEH